MSRQLALSTALMQQVDAGSCSIAKPWTHACLVCNATSLDDMHGHRCTTPKDYARNYWIGRLKWALPDSTDEERAAIVDKPIARTEMARLLGSRWLPSGDIR